MSSVGLRYRGEVVGWVINHQIDPRTVRFTCSFMRKDLSRRARIVPLYSEALRRLSEAGCEFCTFITPTVYAGMVEFIRRHGSPYVELHRRDPRHAQVARDSSLTPDDSRAYIRRQFRDKRAVARVATGHASCCATFPPLECWS